MNQRAYYTLRLVISLLLAVSSVQIVVVFESAAGQCLKNHPARELLMPAVLENTMGSAITNRQAQFKSSDGFFQDALIFDTSSADSIRPFASFFFQFNHRLAQSADQKTITIRAPPVVRL